MYVIVKLIQLEFTEKKKAHTIYVATSLLGLFKAEIKSSCDL